MLRVRVWFGVEWVPSAMPGVHVGALSATVPATVSATASGNVPATVSDRVGVCRFQRHPRVSTRALRSQSCRLEEGSQTFGVCTKHGQTEAHQRCRAEVGGLVRVRDDVDDVCTLTHGGSVRGSGNVSTLFSPETYTVKVLTGLLRRSSPNPV